MGVSANAGMRTSSFSLDNPMTFRHFAPTMAIRETHVFMKNFTKSHAELLASASSYCAMAEERVGMGSAQRPNVLLIPGDPV